MYKKVAYLGLMTCLAMILGYVEMLIPFNFGIPGIKLGVANIISLYVLYTSGVKESFIVLFLRILMTGFLFGNMFGIIYSLSGGILSLIIMSFLYRINIFTMSGVSIIGGVFHNIGQLIIAMIIVDNLNLVFYFPILMISGIVTVLLVGIAANIIYIRVSGVSVR